MGEVFTKNGWNAKYNPFELTTPKGEVLKFERYADAYLYTLKRLKELCPSGYVETAVIIKEMTTATENEAMLQSEHGYKLFKVLREPIMIDWSDMRDETINKLKAIFTTLHLRTSTDLDETGFDFAITRFKEDGKKA